MMRRVVLAGGRGCLLVGIVAIIWPETSLLAGETKDERPRSSGSSRRAALLAKFDLDHLAVERDEIYAGGPDKDGIPALTQPKAVPLKKAKYQDEQRIVVVTIGKKTRGYPLAILNWHEAINDVLGDIPIAVVYCPLCDSVSVVDRRLGEQTLDFGISGLLYNSNVLLYDRKTDALWSQIGLQAISGPHVGKSLKHLPWRLTTFANFVKDFPDADIIGWDTGYQRDYGQNPYVAYFQTDRLMFPITRQDKRLKPKTLVVGVKIGEMARAYPVEKIRQADEGQVADKIGSARIVLKADQSTVEVAEAPREAMVVHTFWFAWAAFHPDTSVYGQSPITGQAATIQPDTP